MVMDHDEESKHVAPFELAQSRLSDKQLDVLSDTTLDNSIESIIAMAAVRHFIATCTLMVVRARLYRRNARAAMVVCAVSLRPSLRMSHSTEGAAPPPRSGSSCQNGRVARPPAVVPRAN
jgi:hypothetical protein